MIPADYLIKMTVDPAVLMSAPGMKQLFGALNNEARFVGGCVRDMLLGQPLGDIDISTPWQPTSTQKRLEAAGFTVYPTGISHGTVLAVTPDKRGQYEVTTLRRDMETDGRHAVVGFTQSYHEDAGRRDLTFNAMSMDRDGNLFDYFDGVTDLKAGVVRFVGDPLQRIREDRLRILRYFRFFARYGTVEPDELTRQAFVSEFHALKKLSGARLNQELSKMLVGPRAPMIVDMMSDWGLLKELLGVPLDQEGFRKLCGLEGVLNVSNVQRRFAVLLNRSRERIDILADRFKWPNRDRQRIRLMAEGALPPMELEPMIYRYGQTAAQDWLLLQATSLNIPVNAELWHVAKMWRPPAFPLRGEQIIEAGIPKGPLVGQVRMILEEWWIEKDFQPDAEEIIEYLHQLNHQGELPRP